MSWELGFKSKTGNTIQLTAGSAVAKFRYIDDYWEGSYTFGWNSIALNVYADGCKSLAEAKTQLIKNVTDKLAELTNTANALKDFQIEGS